MKEEIKEATRLTENSCKMEKELAQLGLKMRAAQATYFNLVTQPKSRILGKMGKKWNFWKDFPTQPPVCSGNDGLPTELDGITFSKWRNESIKGYGNAIVPQIAIEIFRALDKHYHHA